MYLVELSFVRILTIPFLAASHDISIPPGGSDAVSEHRNWKPKTVLEIADSKLR